MFAAEARLASVANRRGIVSSAIARKPKAESMSPTRSIPLLSGRGFSALLLIEVLCYYALRFPDIYNFNRFAFWAGAAFSY